MTNKAFAAIDALAERSGYTMVDPPILQPADLFLDLLGEDMRRRAFLTTDDAGREFLLRPDFTVPVSISHLESAPPDGIGAYAYRGPVFRTRQDGGGEILQGGFESFGRHDIEAADAEMLGLAVDAAMALGLAEPEIRVGDTGLVAAFLERLDLPPVWRRRLASDLQRSRNLDEDLARLAERNAANGTVAHAGFLAALEGSDPGAARSVVADLLSIAGIRPVGGRSVDEIADRFLEQAALSSGSVPPETVALVRRILAVEGDPDAASGSLRAIAAEAAIDVGAALDTFDQRTGFIAARGIDVAAARFSASFGRRLDYYTGFVFELHDAARPHSEPLVGGGRYDRLMTQLGSPSPIPAVGCSIWLDRFVRGSA